MSESSAASYDLDSEVPGELPEYRPVSSLAVVGLLTGLVSVLAFADPLLWALPLVGTALSAAALHRMTIHVPPQVGRKAALIGLTLSLFFGATAVTRWVVFRWQLGAETMQLGKQWFEALREENPYAAHQLTIGPVGRSLPDDDLAVRYAEPNLRKDIEEYVEEPAVRLLLSLGPYAQVRHYETSDITTTPEIAGAVHTYVVSVHQAGNTTSCFVELYWKREFDYESNDWQWKLSSSKILNQPPKGWNSPVSANSR